MKLVIATLCLTLTASAWANHNHSHNPSRAWGPLPGTTADTYFKQLDTNQDGVLSAEEYAAGRNAWQGTHGWPLPACNSNVQPLQDQRVAVNFKARDKNGDGFLTKDETTWSGRVDRFTQFDTNKDGKLSLSELQTGVQMQNNLYGKHRRGWGCTPVAAPIAAPASPAAKK